jgi:hypothetical protein
MKRYNGKSENSFRQMIWISAWQVIGTARRKSIYILEAVYRSCALFAKSG